MKSKQVIAGVLSAATVFVVADAVRGATYYWDADAIASNNVANGPSGGLGTWNAANKNWYNGAAPGTEIVWADGNDAVFAGTGGKVTVSPTPASSFTLGKLTISPTTNPDGYVFTGKLAIASTPTAADLILIYGNTQFNSLSSGTRVNTFIDAGKTLTLAGAGNSSLNKVTGGSVSITGGTFSAGNVALNTALTQTGGTASATAGGNNPTIGASGTGSWTLSGDQAPAVNVAGSVNGTVNFDVGSGNSSSNGTLAINAGTVSVTNGAVLRLGVTNGTGTVNVAGGNLIVTGSNTAYTTVLAIAALGNGNGTLNVSAGTATVDTIQFGQVGTDTQGHPFTAAGTGTLNVSGGALYVGSGGITTGTLPAANTAITLSGGTVGATANWLSSLDMTLSNSKTVTIKAADAADAAHDISLSGNLSGGGALNKTGGGKLTLASAGYTGATTVTAGTLEVNGTLATSGVAVSNGATLQGTGIITNGVSIDGTVAPAGASSFGTLKFGSATFNAGSVLNIDIDATGATDLLNVVGALTLTNAKLNVTGAANGSSYVIGNYGSLLGQFDLANSNLPSGYTVQATGGQISLVSVPEPASVAMLLGFGAFGLLSGRRRRQG